VASRKDYNVPRSRSAFKVAGETTVLERLAGLALKVC
jgi:hypothetical protein